MSEKDRIDLAVDRSLTAPGMAHSGGRFVPSTTKKYSKYQREWAQWATPRGYAIQVTSEALAEYAGDLLRQGAAISTIRTRLAAVRALLRARGEPIPDGVAAWSVLRGANLTRPTRPVKTRILQREALVAIAAVCPTDSPADLRDLCLASLWWELLVPGRYLVRIDQSHITISDQGLRVQVQSRLRRAGVEPARPITEDAIRTIPVDHHHPESEPWVCAACATAQWMQCLLDNGDSGTGPLLRSVDQVGRIGGVHRHKAGPSGPGGRLSERSLLYIWGKLCSRARLPRSTPRSIRLSGAADDVTSGQGLAPTLRRAGWGPNAPATVMLIEKTSEGPK